MMSVVKLEYATDIVTGPELEYDATRRQSFSAVSRMYGSNF
jgi:hypothetical protein